MNTRIIEFIQKKNFILVNNIDQGGMGKTVLFKDNIIDEEFVCKKYSPFYDEHKAVYFKNFIDEIKILFKLYHINIVRVYNYYLYPELTTGYILMEYVQGQNINDYIKIKPNEIESLFQQTISGFVYLEKNKILHRDIRPANILVSQEGVVKIIDFGFGKQINFNEDYDKSISLNWYFNAPLDFQSQVYDFRTEVYFVGKLFENIISEHKLEKFTYDTVLSQMTQTDPSLRISSFSLIRDAITNTENKSIEFTTSEQKDYKLFAENLSNTFHSIGSEASYRNDYDGITNDLEVVYDKSQLEDYLQNTNLITRCFLYGNYRFYRKMPFPVYALKNFIDLFKNASSEKKKIILKNIWNRLDQINRNQSNDDDLPF